MSKRAQTERELFPNCSFIDRKPKDGSWFRLYRDNDIDVMRTRFQFCADTLQPGEHVRWARSDGVIIEEAFKP